MAVHYGIFSSKWGKKHKVPSCKEWAYTFPTGKITDNKDEVDCKRCAKDLGIEPKAKPASKNKSGTCQCCFRTFKLPQGRLSHHGFTRPGVGYDIGQCFGEYALPFEVSCEQTKMFRAHIEKWTGLERTKLDALVSGKIESLIVEVPNYDVPKEKYVPRPTKFVTVNKGDERTKNGPGTIPSFASVLDMEVRKTRQSIEMGETDIAFLTGKIDNWKPVEGF